MDFIMLNLNKIVLVFQKYEKLYHDSIAMKRIYKHLLSHLTQKNNIPVSDLNLDIGIDTDDEIPWQESFQNMKIYENFFINIKKNKISFQTGKIYCMIFSNFLFIVKNYFYLMKIFKITFIILKWLKI